MRHLTILAGGLAASVAAGPAMAATGPFFSLHNTDFVVLLGFLVFVGILIYFKVPQRITDALDSRAQGIRKDLDEAKALRDEAQALLASYDRKTRQARADADQIVATAKADAEGAAEQAKVDLEKSVARRIESAEEQIESAKASAIREVRDRAISVAIAAAGEVVAGQLSAAQAKKMIDESIETVSKKLH
ncbi:F-type ATPase subunit b [Jannaschia seosinensis]|uniref:ATP synthase subunit b n=1 Tax=Jannaschia seosinensis TaxID=313367 RepID=A0A0M7BDH3_9RHOB|nr:F0F1 ATP synthase subunit B [Jannaschia seosinensis]CUH40118.1 F-type ATPase subunit b [Jannaschia seosinensis]